MFDLNQLLDGLPEKVTITFFAAFARFEYALMQCQFLRAIGKDRRADVDWEKLANALELVFLSKLQDEFRR